jgi:uncharacterized membrane protein YoaK (UPF0700 family)
MLQACLLALIAGYADTVGFLGFGVFAGLMTGNTILGGIALAGPAPGDSLPFGMVIFGFFSGVLLCQGVLRLGSGIWLPLGLSALLLAGCGFVDRALAGPMLAMAMGAQNAAVTRFGGITLNTVFLTGNLQALARNLVALLWRSAGATARPNGTLLLSAVWLAFAVGAVGGAAMQGWMHHPLLVPALILPFVPLLVRARTQEA